VKKLRVVLATHNPHKRAELQDVLEDELPGSIHVLTLEDMTPPIGDIPETGTTLYENALIKAKTVHRLTGLPTIADDTGLEVSALNGGPGVYSARYAGENATYEDNVRKLLSALTLSTDRSARFRTAICYVDSDGIERFFDGSVEGSITRQPRGDHGFGYDPIFEPTENDNGLTFAEMSPSQKNVVSHRARALRSFAHWMRANIATDPTIL
jgi:XTP/dITP diphosphohydrolase